MSDRRLPKTAPAYNALKRAESALPAAWYFDPQHYARELATLWRRNWLYLCRADALAEPLAFKTFEIGDQNILLLRDGAGQLRTYHNCCRHRGSILCPAAEGRLKSKAIVCPYHLWSYAAEDGRLLRTSSFAEPQGFERARLGLFKIALADWRGCVFVNLDPEATWDPAEVFQRPPDNLANFPLEDMVVGQRWQTRVACNWKVFWENFNECLHCPNVHPSLTKLVPLFTRRIVHPRDLPDWPEHQESDDPKYRGGLRDGVETWSLDGTAQGHVIASLSEADLARGHSYASAWPSVFFGGYPDHMRFVRLLPRGPEETELIAEWLYPEATLAAADYKLENTVAFAQQVMQEDAAACELSQRGLRAAPLEAGVLMPEEYHVKRFQDWVRKGLA